MHLASEVTERAVKLEWRIIDLAKLVGQGLQRSKTYRSFTRPYLIRRTPISQKMMPVPWWNLQTVRWNSRTTHHKFKIYNNFLLLFFLYHQLEVILVLQEQHNKQHFLVSATLKFFSPILANLIVITQCRSCAHTFLYLYFSLIIKSESNTI